MQSIAEPTASPTTTGELKPARTAAFAVAMLFGLLADYLIPGWTPGLGLVLFFAAVGAGVIVTCRPSERASRNRQMLAGVILFAALVPLLEDFSPLSLAIALAGLCAFTLIVTGSRVSSPFDGTRKAVGLLISGPFTFPAALIGIVKEPGKRRRRVQWSGWVVPVLFGALFIYLFQSANPIIETWLSRLDFLSWLIGIDFGRVTFALLVMVLCWPFLQGRLPQRAPWRIRRAAVPERSAVRRKGPSATEILLSHSAIVRSLVLFNAIFAIQTALDIVYLWGGRELPDGMSFAAYAHRGAYPLVATALIAAAFTLVALRRDSETESSVQVRNLILLWVGQNVLLVASSIFRLDLYVSVYSLTLLRVEAFVWMGLVAMGLVLIMVRVLCNFSNRWLVHCNLIVLALTLYCCSLVNIPAYIAHYNVQHSREVSGRGVPLDVGYLESLGPQVIPALDRYHSLRRKTASFYSPGLNDRTLRLERELFLTLQDWRRWSLRQVRLRIYLKNRYNPEP